MKHTVRIMFALLVVLYTACFAFADSPYSTNANQAVLWLSGHQNNDGSWGSADDIKLPCTVSAVSALQALNQRTPAYYWGVAWLENHHAPNIDYAARRILALALHGDNVQNDLARLQAAQMLVSPGNSGWGLTNEYQGTPLDSAIALLASSQLGVSTNIQPALNYLKGAQLTGTDKGWTVAQESMSDPQTTALVLQSMINYTELDPSLSTNIDNGILSLAANVNTSSPIQLQALGALTYIRAGYAANATPLLNAIAAAQSGDGSWSQNPYVTAVAMRAFATAMETDLEGLSEIVSMPDNALRAAVNASLGKNSMDALTKGDLANLITLDAAGMGISNLTGIEWAINLTSADFSNNNITDTTPLDEIPGSPVINLDNNPGAPPPDMPPGYPDITSPVTTASPAGENFYSSFSVTLTCDDGAGSGCDKIYYTTDGSTPTTSSASYTIPITITGTTTLKFFAVDVVGNNEDVKTESYAEIGDTAWTNVDFNGDGNQDILWRNKQTGQVNIWLTNPNDIGQLSSGFPGTFADMNWEIIGVGNFNTATDTKTDILWKNKQTGEVNVWLIDGTSQLPGSGTLGIISDMNWEIINTGDFNSDSNTDLLWRNKQTGQLSIWLTNPNSIGLLSSGSPGTVADMNWEIIDVGNFNTSTDINTDILWRNKQTGMVNVWLINGTAFLSGGTLSTVGDMNWEVINTGDFNSDGNTDILWRHSQTGMVNVWLTNPSGIGISSYGTLDTAADMNWEIIGAGNFNTATDTNTDILWKNKQTGEVNVWLIDGTVRSSYGTLDTVSDLNWEIIGVGNFNTATDTNTDILWRNKQTGEVKTWLTDPSSIGVLNSGTLGTVSDMSWEIQ